MRETIGRGRLEAFSDGVIAIILTIMVLELKVPAAANWSALQELTPVFLSYVLSFLVVAIMWVNHHHLMHTVTTVYPKIMWMNNFLLFWMSLIPFVTGVLGQGKGESLPVALYGFDLTMCSLGFWLLRWAIRDQHRENAEMLAIHNCALKKNLFANLLYSSTVPFAFFNIHISYAIFVLIPALYFLPEQTLAAGVELPPDEKLPI